VVTRGKVRRAKLYYLRELRGKKARIRERRVGPEELAAAQTTLAEGAIQGTTEEPGPVEVSADDGEAPETAAVDAESKG
jgi:hypothetical protein